MYSSADPRDPACATATIEDNPVSGIDANNVRGRGFELAGPVGKDISGYEIWVGATCEGKWAGGGDFIEPIDRIILAGAFSRLIPILL